MVRARILLCPQFTEVEWTIAPQLAEWAEVATFDAPGVGDEPIRSGDPADFDRELVVQRALHEIEDRGWDSYFVVGDAWGTATAVRVARARPEPVLGLALGHASLDYQREGRRPAVSKEVTAAMTQLLRSDYDSFVRYGMTQFTQGAIRRGNLRADRRPVSADGDRVKGMGVEHRPDRADRRTPEAGGRADAALEARGLPRLHRRGLRGRHPAFPEARGRASARHRPPATSSPPP